MDGKHWKVFENIRKTLKNIGKQRKTSKTLQKHWTNIRKSLKIFGNIGHTL
jgi:hypothetical protein